MLTLKETMEKDLEVFFNSDELAEEHKINGKMVTILVDDERLTELKAKAQYAAGVFTADKLIKIKASDFGPRPAIKSLITYDGKKYRVMQVTGSLVYEMLLETTQ